MGLGEEREYLQPQTHIQLEGLFPIMVGEGRRFAFLGVKNPSFQHLWAEVTFLSPLKLSQAFSPFLLIVRSKIKPLLTSIQTPTSQCLARCVWGRSHRLK